MGQSAFLMRTRERAVKLMRTQYPELLHLCEQADEADEVPVNADSTVP